MIRAPLVPEHIPYAEYREYAPDEMRRRAAAFHAEVRRRRSVRDFSDRPVPRGIIEDCIRAAGTAPSGANHQPWFFTVIGDPGTKRRIRQAAEIEERQFYEGKAGQEWLDALGPLDTDADKPFLEAAPWLIAIFAQRRGGVRSTDQRKNYYVPESVGIATGFLIAALHNAGLATLTHTPSPMTFLTEICGRPASERATILLVTGYPRPDAQIPVHATIKKPFEAICRFM